MRVHGLLLPLLASGACGLALGACGDGDKIIEFPGGLEPLEDPVPTCPGDAANPGEEVTVDSERGEETFNARACGWVLADFDAVTAAVGTPDVGVDRRAVDLADITVTFDTDPTYELTYDVDTLVHDTVDVQYVLSWRHGSAGEGVWASRWQMTTENPFVLLLEGSVVTTATDAAVKVEMVEHIDALLDDEEEVIVQFLDDFHASIVASAHGESLPVWE